MTNAEDVARSFLFVFFSVGFRRCGMASAGTNVNQHLEMGKTLLAAGQLSDALSHYHAAVEGEPDNYLTYYKRATVFLALGKSRSALPDLDRVLELRPDFSAARMQRGHVLLKLGKLDEAEEDYEALVAHDPHNAEAIQHLETVRPLREDIQQAKQLYSQRDYQGAIELLTRALEACPWNPELREIRAECYIAQGDLFKAVHDIRPTTKLRVDNTAAYFKLSMLHYQMGDADESLVQIRECLKLDPDHKDCFAHYKKVKKLAKQLNDAQESINKKQYDTCISKSQQVLKTEPNYKQFILKAKSNMCHCHSKAGNMERALKRCGEVLELDPENVNAFCDRGDAFISAEMYDEAMKDFQEAQNLDEASQRAHDGHKKAQKLLKQSKKRDYYKILNVKRTASKKDILKAYRKLAVKWHPDRYKDDDKKTAEKMFIDIAAAKEVLTNPEKREKFDNGEDPLDPESQNNGHGGPFWHQGFDPFGSGGFQFKFHFN